ncbi:MAG: hypothetical protein M0Q49_08360 [Porticoccaceae bacterium]|nr:hypothetical protein [Porticoccaceae bacterium]
MSRYAQLNTQGICIAESVLHGTVEAAELIPLEPGAPSPIGMQWTGEVWQVPAVSLPDARTQQIAIIRDTASSSISQMQWRIERAVEREQLGLPGETITAVQAEREAMRRASNRLEAAIDAAETVEQVQAITWEVTEADYPTPARITRQEFMDRFTEAELSAVLTAVEQNIQMRAWFERFRVVGGVVLTDPRTIAGVQALEMISVLGPGRADEILAI